MINKLFNHSLSFSIGKPNFLKKLGQNPDIFFRLGVLVFLTAISLGFFLFYFSNNQNLAYNDAGSHLNIARRVVESLNPGMAQLGSVWLPLNHILMLPTIWNDWMWHTGLSGSLQSMIGFVVTGVLIDLILKKFKVGYFGRVIGVLVFALNLNALYLQSTAMTELLLLTTMTLGCYSLINWSKSESVVDLVKAAFWIFLSTLTRYDGWFLLIFSTGIVMVLSALKNYPSAAVKKLALKEWGLEVFRLVRKNFSYTEGVTILFLTLAGIGVLAWFGWNQLIFKDPLYFALGKFSAHAQQAGLDKTGNLTTKGNMLLSTSVYIFTVFYNSYFLPVLFAAIGMWKFFKDREITPRVRVAAVALIAPLFFNILALFFGFSTIHVDKLNGSDWFNTRYGIMLLPAVAIFTGYLVSHIKITRYIIVTILLFMTTFSLLSQDAVTINDAHVDTAGKMLGLQLRERALNKPGFILTSTGYHDPEIFTSGLPMSRFIHEGTGLYWEEALSYPDKWARWIIVWTGHDNDETWKRLKVFGKLAKYNVIHTGKSADLYELKPEFVKDLIQKPVFGPHN